MDREKLDEQKTVDYGSSIELAKRCVGDRHFDAAIQHVRRAISLDPGRPEAFNLLGALMEIQGIASKPRRITGRPFHLILPTSLP